MTKDLTGQLKKVKSNKSRMKLKKIKQSVTFQTIAQYNTDVFATRLLLFAQKDNIEP